MAIRGAQRCETMVLKLWKMTSAAPSSCNFLAHDGICNEWDLGLF